MERTLRLLEFDKVKGEVAHLATTQLGREKAETLEPSFDRKQVDEALQATDEALHALRIKGDPPFGGIQDIRSLVMRARVNSRLDGPELVAVADTLSGGRKLKQYLRQVAQEKESPLLSRLEEAIAPLKEVEEAIRSSLDPQGEVLDEASPALAQIRHRIKNLEQRIRARLEEMVRSPSWQKMLQEPIFTIRNDRYCLPVKAEYRHAFKGLIHDESASGATLFIEPEGIVTLSNELNEAKRAEEKEVDRILRQLTAQIGKESDRLAENLEALAELDFIFAKAYYARKIKGVLPRINEKGYFKLLNARHPFIPEGEVVPNTIELGGAYTCLVITGPNTGGKTVTLKTLGLLTLMACSGLFVPAEEGTEVAVSPVYADIGDEQSIEQSLSTFSSHMCHIVRMMGQVEANSLVLLDEVGAGTDPAEGAALAMAILDAMIQKGARVVATTHYGELKAFAYTRPGVINASVEFDVDTLQPTYRLLLGVPGRSHALYIAAKLGLDREIIDQAQRWIKGDERRIDQLLQDLEKSRKQAEQEKMAWQKRKEEAERLREELAKERAALEKEKERLLAQARQEAEEKMDRLLKEAESLISQLRQLQQEGHRVKEHQLIEAKSRLNQLDDEISAPHRSVSPSPSLDATVKAFRPGDEVYVEPFGQKGFVLEKLTDQEYLVQIGLIKTKVKAKDLKKVKEESAKQKVTIVNTPVKTVGLELDVRGQTAEEAMAAVDKYLDDCLLAGYHQVYIIHGKGTGQLRKSIQAFLRNHKRVKEFRLGNVGEGGSGVTVVTLR